MCCYVEILPIYIHIYIRGKFYPFYLHSQRTFSTLYFEIYVKYTKYIQNHLQSNLVKLDLKIYSPIISMYIHINAGKFYSFLHELVRNKSSNVSYMCIHMYNIVVMYIQYQLLVNKIRPKFPPK